MTKTGENGAARSVFDAMAGDPGDLPPIGAELEEELSRARPVKPRRPRLQLAIAAAIALAYAGGLVAYLSIRPDLGALPPVWVAGYAGLWLAGFVGLAYVATVPPPGAVMPRRRLSGVLGISASIAFVVAGLVWSPVAPGLSMVHPPTFEALIAHGGGCLQFGLLAAIVPLAITALAIRGSVPGGCRGIGFALGAAGGSVGGLMLHFSCAMATPLHNGLVHGLVVLVAGGLGALAVPRMSR